MTAEVKGTGFRSSVSYMRGVCTEAQWHDLLRAFGPGEREIVENLHAADRYSIAMANTLYRAYASVMCIEDAEECRAAFESIGRRIAEDDLVGVYKIMTSVMSPPVLARFLPAQWRLYFPGVDVEVEEFDLENRCVVNVVRGLGGFAYISPVAAEWMRYAFEKVGAKDVMVRESAYDAGDIASDELRYTVEWN